AWDRYKDLFHACPHHGFTELHQLDTFYNALNPADQDSLNAAAGGDLLERHIQTYSCSQSANECCNYRHDGYSQTISSNPPPASVKSVEEIYVTCGGAHPYYQCLAAGGNTFSELQDNIQGYVSTAAVNYNQGNSVYRPPCMANQIQPPGFAQSNVQNNQNSHANSNHVVKNELRNEMKNSIQASLSNQTNEIKNMMASLFQMNYASTSGSGSLPSNTVANPKGKLKAITTRSGLVLDGPTIPTPLPFINQEEDERVEETLMDSDLSEYTIKVSPPLVQKYKPPSQRDYVVHQRDPLHPNIPYPSRMLKQKQQEKDEKMLKALLSNKEKLQELANTPLNENCSAVILKKLPEKLGDRGKFLIPCGFSLPELISTRMTLKLANRAICTPVGIARDVFVPVGKFTFPSDFVIVDNESDPRVPFILGRPFLRTARALIDVHGEEMILRDGDERLTLNMRHDTSSHSNQPQKESINLINVFNNSSEDFLEDLFSTDQPTGNPTFFSHPELTSPKVKDDIFDSEGGNVLLEKLIDLDSTKDLHPSLHDRANMAKKAAKGCDTFVFLGSSVLTMSAIRLFRVDALSSTNNEDKVFNPGILIQEKPFEIITRVVQDKKLATSNASLVLKDFDPPLYEPLFFKEVPRALASALTLVDEAFANPREGRKMIVLS
nr:hypothetical protein [Tanacetum cinerariifolium]